VVAIDDASRFAVVRRLGEGATGIVYEAHDRKHDTRVALKTLRAIAADRLYELKHEFRALADISHPNLVTLFDLVMCDEHAFFTMELVDGGIDLLSYVRPDDGGTIRRPTCRTMTLVPSVPARRQTRPGCGSACDVGRLRAAMVQLADGVDGLHRAGKLHRDLKPSNVLVAPDGRLVICDFGLVIDVDAAARVRGANAVGTAVYMSPEQAANLPLAAASDWYSVGVMLHEALVGVPPFDGTADAVLARKQVDVPRRPSELADDVPADLDQLCVDLLRRRPADRPSGGEVMARLRGEGAHPAATGRRPTSVAAELVGRDAHLAALDAALAASNEGRAVIVHVKGRTGMGKTALVRRFVERVSSTGAATVFAGACYQSETVPFKAVDSLIDELSAYLLAIRPNRIQAVLPPDAGVLARLFPVLRRVEALAGPASAETVIDPGELRQQAFRALRVVLTGIAAFRPLVLWVDDIQWGDVDSVALLAELVRAPDPPAILFIGCHRTDDGDVGPFVRAFEAPAQALAGGELDVREITVDALSIEDASALASTLIADGGTDHDAATIARESGGSPLFVNELVRYAGSSTISLDAVIRRRVGRLPPESRDLLTVVAVAGRPVPRGVVVAALAAADSERRALIELRAERLIRTGGEHDIDAIATYHETIRRAVIGALGPDELRRYHRRIAVALETTDRDDPEALADHWSAAGRLDLASRYALVAAGRAAQSLAFDRAARLYRVALAHATLGAAERHSIELRLGDALANAGRGAEAADVYQRAAAGAAPGAALELRSRASLQYLRSGHFANGIAAIDETLAPAGLRLAATPRRALVSVALRRAWLRVRGLGFHERAASELPADRLARVDACWSVAAVFGMLDSVRGSDFQARHLQLALSTGEPFRVCRGLALETTYSAIAGGRDDRRTRTIAARCAALAERLDDPVLRGLATMTSAVAAFMRGGWAEARAGCDAAERRFRTECTGLAPEIDTAQTFSLGALAFQGDLLELRRRVPWILADAERRGDLFALNTVRRGRANLRWLVDDDVAGARAALAEAVRTWPRTGFNPQHYFEILTEGQIDLYADQPDLAFGRLRDRWRTMARSQMLRIQVARIEMWFLRARSALALAAGSRDRALLAQVRADAARIEHEAMGWSAGLARLLRAGIAHTTGDREAAAGELARADTELRAAGMVLHAAVARRRRGELVGGDVGRALVAEADAWMRVQGVHRAEAICAMIAPGLR
jgi:eukaryotic-like serine/threonine-protein kinase